MDDTILDKLSKILALTNSPVEGERNAAIAMLQKLLTKHNMSMADLERRGERRAPGIKKDSHDLGKAAFTWKLDLADGMARHFFCYPIVNRYSKTVAFVGRPENVESLQMLYAWVIDQIKRLASEERKAHHAQTGEHIDPLRWQVNFGLGSVRRLIQRLEEERQAAHSDEMALVVCFEDEINDWFEEQGEYRRDGKETKAARARREAYEQENAEWKALLETDPEAAYAKRPWERPLTPEQQAQADKDEKIRRAKQEKAEAAWSKRWEKRQQRETRQSWSEIEKEQQASTARSSGRRAADRVNLQPFVTGATPTPTQEALR